MLDILKIDPLSSQHTRDAVMKKFGLLPDVSEMTHRRKIALLNYHQKHLNSARELEQRIGSRYKLLKESRMEVSPDFFNPLKINSNSKISEGLKQQVWMSKKLDSIRGIDLFDKKYRSSHESVAKLGLGSSNFLSKSQISGSRNHRITQSVADKNDSMIHSLKASRPVTQRQIKNSL